MEKKVLICVFSIFLLLSCSKDSRNIVLNKIHPMRLILSSNRKNLYNIKDESKRKDREFYRAVVRYKFDLDKVKELLENGADPNYCYGECGWVDSNPLMVLCQGTFFCYTFKRAYGEIPPILPDIDLINTLVKYGADINKYPYIWSLQYYYTNDDIKKLDKEKDAEQIKSFFIDIDRILEAFLKAGASPNKRGHSYPFSYDSPDNMSEEELNSYFDKGTTPINEAIKKGMMWESQVDLLLKYGAKLDSNSLKAAQESGDKDMLLKIKNLL